MHIEKYFYKAYFKKTVKVMQYEMTSQQPARIFGKRNQPKMFRILHFSLKCLVCSITSALLGFTK